MSLNKVFLMGNLTRSKLTVIAENFEFVGGREPDAKPGPQPKDDEVPF